MQNAAWACEIGKGKEGRGDGQMHAGNSTYLGRGLDAVNRATSFLPLEVLGGKSSREGGSCTARQAEIGHPSLLGGVVRRRSWI